MTSLSAAKTWWLQVEGDIPHMKSVNHSLSPLLPSLSCPHSKWLEHKVPLTHVHRCHVLDYEPQLVSIILSHCHYSLRAGKGHDITYDFPSLQKHILDRYILGKPILLMDISEVVYRKDVYTATTFANIREKVKKQVSMDLYTCNDFFLGVHLFSSVFLLLFFLPFY